MTSPDQFLALQNLKDVIREPYTFPGGYPKALIMSGGGVCCRKCAEEHFRSIVKDTISPGGFGDSVHSSFINWESDDLECEFCESPLESAYGENS